MMEMLNARWNGLQRGAWNVGHSMSDSPLGRLARIRTLLLAWGLVLAALAPARAAAQTGAADTVGVRAALRHHHLCPGGTVRVAVGEERVQGRCDGVLDARLLVWTAGATRRLPLTEVDSLYLRRGGFDGGVRTGAIAGGVGGLLLGYVMMSSYCGDASNCGEGVLLGSLGMGAVGSLAGMLVGGSLGSAFRTWVRVHPD
jgi:hypothetical protein